MNKASYDFVNRWGDEQSKTRLRNSDKSSDVQKAECENALKDMAMRFERQPNASTLRLWAFDLVDSGYQDWMVKEVCKSIPKKFEKHPTLAQVMDLLRPYLPQIEFKEDDLDKYSRLALSHLRAKFDTMLGTGTLATVSAHYKRLVIDPNFPNNQHWTQDKIEMCVLCDWCRTYFKPSAQAIIDQGRISNEEASKQNKEYFVKHLKQYCIENKLV